ncbi:MAG TPA: hypothetical protein PLV34_06895 [Bacillota bacterium]|nr:hypothetical protein [Bacillota bacterium]
MQAPQGRRGKDLLYRGTYGQLTKAEEGVRIGVPNICRNGLCGAQLSAGVGGISPYLGT